MRFLMYKLLFTYLKGVLVLKFDLAAGLLMKLILCVASFEAEFLKFLEVVIDADVGF